MVILTLSPDAADVLIKREGVGVLKYAERVCKGDAVPLPRSVWLCIYPSQTWSYHMHACMYTSIIVLIVLLSVPSVVNPRPA